MIGRAMLRPLATARVTARFASTAPMLPKARLAFPRAALAAAAAAATGERRPTVPSAAWLLLSHRVPWSSLALHSRLSIRDTVLI